MRVVNEKVRLTKKPVLTDDWGSQVQPPQSVTVDDTRKPILWASETVALVRKLGF